MVTGNSVLYGCSLTSGTMVILFINLVWQTVDLLMSVLRGELTLSDVVVYIFFGGSSVLGMIGVFVKIRFLLIPFMVVQLFSLAVMIILMLAFPFAKEFMLNELRPESQTKAVPAASPTVVSTKSPTKVPTTVSIAVPNEARTPLEVPITSVIVVELLMALGCIVFLYTIIIVLSCYKEMKENSKQ